MNKSQLPKFIPSTPILPVGPLSKAFLKLGVKAFDDAVLWVYQLPYGRNSDRADYMLIFEELQGTCSTKHAALAALAKECQLPIILKMVICKLDQNLDPKVKPLLERLGVDYVPEAHCYLSCPHGEIDVTFPNQPPYPKVEVLKEYIISTDEIGDQKLALHKEFLKAWIKDTGLSPSFSFDHLWQLREEWIRSLASRSK